jgi:exopolysaccharide/PEP-CTERM locus tyrosine autokinase
MGKMFDALQKLEREKFPDSEDQQRKVPDVALDNALDDRLVSYFAPSSMVTEQFRRLRTHIIKPGSTDGPKTIMITGAMSGEGKSLVAVNLAIIIAVELQSHALLIDCDLRNPSISRWFGLHEEKGLSDYLLGNAEIPDLLVKTAVDKLSILCGGSIQDNPVELIGSAKMKNLLLDLKTRYNDRYIILDSSPLLATTEPTVLNEMADAILLVIKAGETPRESVQQALRRLDKNKVMGVILNDMEFKTRALIQQNFGTNHKYYDYRYAKNHPEPTFLDKFGMLAGDLKMFVNNIMPGKKKED